MNAITTTATKQAYHFRGFPIASPSAKQAAELTAKAACFDKVDATVGGKVVPSFKRKSEEHVINLPVMAADTILTAPELALVNELLVELTSDYCKVQFVDLFKAVGAHTLADIIAHRAEMASRKPSGAALDVPSAEALALGEKVLSDYLVLVAPAFAPRIAASKLLTSKATNTAIARCLGDVTAKRHGLIVGRVKEAISMIPELELNAEDTASAQAALNYLLKRLAAFANEMFAATVGDDDM
jgi:hypothetical protein